MVNLVAGRRVVPELIQKDLTADALVHEAARLLDDPGARTQMKKDLGEVAAKLASARKPMEMAAGVIEDMVKEQVSNAS
jgi:lipid-A-disaccharide synthase